MYSLESPLWGNSKEYTQHTFSMTEWENFPKISLNWIVPSLAVQNVCLSDHANCMDCSVSFCESCGSLTVLTICIAWSLAVQTVWISCLAGLWVFIVYFKEFSEGCVGGGGERDWNELQFDHGYHIYPKYLDTFDSCTPDKAILGLPCDRNSYSSQGKIKIIAGPRSLVDRRVDS